MRPGSVGLAIITTRPGGSRGTNVGDIEISRAFRWLQTTLYASLSLAMLNLLATHVIELALGDGPLFNPFRCTAPT